MIYQFCLVLYIDKYTVWDKTTNNRHHSTLTNGVLNWYVIDKNMVSKHGPKLIFEGFILKFYNFGIFQ